MLVYRVFTQVCSVLSASAVHFLSMISFIQSKLDDEGEGFRLCDFVYLRSPFLQAHFAYRLNYQEYYKGMMGELNVLTSKCGVKYETHTDINQTILSGGRIDLYHLTSNETPDISNKRTVVLVHGILQSIDVFICGGKDSLAYHLLRNGCDVWLLRDNIRNIGIKDESISATATISGEHSLQLVEADVCVVPVVQEKADSLTCESLNVVAKYIEEYNYNRVGKCEFDSFADGMDVTQLDHGSSRSGSVGIHWIGHSTACGSILTALTYSSSVHANVTAELRRRTAGAALLSPVLSLTHLNRYASSTTADSIPSSVNTLKCEEERRVSLLLEVLLHSPDSVYALVGSDVLLQSLQQCRDFFTVPTYCNYVIAPLCRSMFGWTFANIASYRRNDLLQYLMQPTSTNALVSLLHASQGNMHVESAYFGSRLYNLVLNVYTLYRWLWRCAFLVADVSLGLASKVVGIDLAMYVYGVPSSDNTRVVASNVADSRIHTESDKCSDNDMCEDTHSNSRGGSARQQRFSAKGSATWKPRILSFVGSDDVLSNKAELETTLALLGEQYSFESDVRVVAGYEHMDSLWADSAPELVFHVI